MQIAVPSNINPLILLDAVLSHACFVCLKKPYYHAPFMDPMNGLAGTGQYASQSYLDLDPLNMLWIRNADFLDRLDRPIRQEKILF